MVFLSHCSPFPQKVEWKLIGCLIIARRLIAGFLVSPGLHIKKSCGCQQMDSCTPCHCCSSEFGRVPSCHPLDLDSGLTAYHIVDFGCPASQLMGPGVRPVAWRTYARRLQLEDPSPPAHQPVDSTCSLTSHQLQIVLPSSCRIWSPN